MKNNDNYFTTFTALELVNNLINYAEKNDRKITEINCAEFFYFLAQKINNCLAMGLGNGYTKENALELFNGVFEVLDLLIQEAKK